MHHTSLHRRDLIVLAAALPGLGFAQTAQTDDATWAALKAPGSIVLFRHAIAPGVGDPPGFKVGDCATQRNLSEEGKAQAKRIGQALSQRGVKVQAVWHSAWCRARDTAELAFPDLRESAYRAEPAFNSFFADRSVANTQTATARKLLLAWPGPGTLVVVTHQVNIAVLTDISPQAGEGIVLQRQGQRLQIKGRIQP
jgi:phosphohistidine phosphatase SixA